MVCLIIFSRFGLDFSLSFFVHTAPTNSEGFIVLYKSNSNIVSCRASSTGCNVSIPNSSSFCVRCHSIGGGGSSKANFINLRVSGSDYQRNQYRVSRNKYDGTHLSLYYLQDAVDPLAHVLPRDRVEELVQFGQQCRVSLEIVKVVFDPVLQHVQDTARKLFSRFRFSNTYERAYRNCTGWQYSLLYRFQSSRCEFFCILSVSELSCS